VSLLRVDSYQAWTNMVRGFIARLSPAEAAAILDENAMRIYDL
jgi:predicted TIM-barrel fold metal-dependent hydrolase